MKKCATNRRSRCKGKMIVLFIIVFFAVASPFVVSGFLDINEAQAFDFRATLTGTAKNAGVVGEDGVKTLPEIVGVIVRSVLIMLGVLFFVLVVSAGLQWMTAGGNEEKVAKAKKNLGNALVGLIIVIGSYTIVYFVIDILANQG